MRVGAHDADLWASARRFTITGTLIGCLAVWGWFDLHDTGITIGTVAFALWCFACAAADRALARRRHAAHQRAVARARARAQLERWVTP